MKYTNGAMLRSFDLIFWNVWKNDKYYRRNNKENKYQSFHVVSKNPAIITSSPATDLKWLAEVWSSRGLEDTTGILRPGEQNDRAGIWFLA